MSWWMRGKTGLLNPQTRCLPAMNCTGKCRKKSPALKPAEDDRLQTEKRKEEQKIV